VPLYEATLAHLLAARSEGGGIVRLDHHLDHAGVVAQVDEDHATVVAPCIRPAAEHHVVAGQGLVDSAAQVAAKGSLGGHGTLIARGKGPRMLREACARPQTRIAANYAQSAGGD
jgi:hypothetical protein